MRPEEGHFVRRTARYRMVEAKACQPECARVQLPPHPPSPPNPPIPSLPPLASNCPSYTTSWMPQAGMPQARMPQAGMPQAGPEPQRGGFIGDRRGGPCEGGRPRGWPGLSRTPARIPQSQCAAPLALTLALGPETGGAENGWGGVHRWEKICGRCDKVWVCSVGGFWYALI